MLQYGEIGKGVRTRGEMDQDWLAQILYDNEDKEFVKRILNPNVYPRLNVGNREASHLMSWGEVDNKFLVYPTVQWGKGRLTRYSPEEALMRALEAGNFINFKNAEEAEWFSKHYKDFWRQ